MQRKNTPSKKTGKNLIGMQTHLAFEGEKINWKKIKQPEDSFLKSLNYKDIKLLLVNNSMYKQISGILTHYMLVFKSGRVKHRASLWNAF